MGVSDTSLHVEGRMICFFSQQRKEKGIRLWCPAREALWSTMYVGPTEPWWSGTDLSFSLLPTLQDWMIASLHLNVRFRSYLDSQIFLIHKEDRSKVDGHVRASPLYPKEGSIWTGVMELTAPHVIRPHEDGTPPKFQGRPTTSGDTTRFCRGS